MNQYVPWIVAGICVSLSIWQGIRYWLNRPSVVVTAEIEEETK
jgi:hypothetical protein